MPSPLIAIIDDDADTSAMLNHVLTEAGYQTWTGGWDDRVVQFIAVERPDVIVLGVHADLQPQWHIVDQVSNVPGPRIPVLVCGDNSQLIEAMMPDLKKQRAFSQACTYDPEEFKAKIKTMIPRTDSGEARQSGNA